MDTNPRARNAAPLLLAMQILFLAATAMTPSTGNLAYDRRIPLLWAMFSAVTVLTGLVVAVRYEDPRAIVAPVLSLALVEALVVFSLF